MPKKSVAVAALTLKIADPTGREIQLLPAGRFTSIDGRPASIAAATEWVCLQPQAQAVIAAANGRLNRLVIDYEHQTLNTEKNGQPAPASGWFKSMQWREGLGLFAIDVQWTPAAARAIAAEEYSYISPVFQFDPKTGEVQRMLMAALTNNPGIDGMQPVALSALNHFDDSDKEIGMNALLKALLQALGLNEQTAEPDALAALTAHLATANGNATRVAELSASITDREAQISALRANSGTTPDPARFVPISVVTGMQTQLATLTAQVNGRELDEVVTTALSAGKLLPAQESWARDLGKKDFAALTSFIATAPVIAALQGTQTKGVAPTGLDGGELDAATLAVCRMFNNDPEQVKATAKGNTQ